MAETTKAPEEQTPPPTGHQSIHEAFIAVLGELEPLIKDEKGNYREYATLSAVTKVIRPVLKNHNLGYFTYFEGVNQPEPTLVNRLFNAAGESIEQYYPVICVQRNDPQKFGGAITYARRYSTMAFFGMAPEDDDGEAASEKSRTSVGGGTDTRTPPLASRKQASQPASQTSSNPPAQTDEKPTTRSWTTDDGETVEVVPCEIAGCNRGVTPKNYEANRNGHDGHTICKFHHDNGDWKAALTTQESASVPQTGFDAGEAAFIESLNPSVMVNPDGSTQLVTE